MGERDLARPRRRASRPPAPRRRWSGGARGRGARRGAPGPGAGPPRCGPWWPRAPRPAERREEAGKPARQHGLAAARGAEEEQVVVAGGGDLQRALGARLPGHVPRGRARRRGARAAARRRGARRAGRARRAQATSSPRWRTGRTTSPSTAAASRALAAGDRKARAPSRSAATAMGSTPRTGRTSPERESSPQRCSPSSGRGGTSPQAASSATAMGRSNPVPSLRRSAGARFTVIRLTGAGTPGCAPPRPPAPAPPAPLPRRAR